jgi:hypothetical protein
MTFEVDITYSPLSDEGRRRQHINLFIHIVMEEGILDIELMPATTSKHLRVTNFIYG